jgi:DNA-binding PadR family transcriptional regulator
MSGWLASGLRRDVCIAVAGLDAPTDREVKREIEERYGKSVPPRRFYGALEELEKDGYLEREVEGIHDRFSLTDAGERALEAQYEWFGERLE